METETQSGGDSLIIADKSKEDSNVAQKIQAECDKKFNNNSKVISSEEQTANGNGDLVEVDFDGHEDSQQMPIHNGSHHPEKPEEKEVDVQLDSLNVSNDKVHDDDAEEKPGEIELQNGDSVEKPTESEESNETKEEIVENVETKEELVDNVIIKEEIAENVITKEEIVENVITEEEIVENEDNIQDEIVRSASPTIIEEICKLEQQSARPREIIPPETVQAAPVIEDEMKAQKETASSGPRKGAIATSMDTESVRDAYNDIRADNSKTQWAVFKYEASRIVCSAKGVAFDEFKEQFDEDERAYGYIRLQTGDEMSKRHKFLFVTWIGPSVSVLKRAKMSIDKAIIKNVVSNFAMELQLETLAEFDLPFFIESLNKASGANYGTGVRDI